jgi:hypothetical protein
VSDLNWHLAVATVGGVVAVVTVTLVARAFEVPYASSWIPTASGLVTGLVGAAVILWLFGGEDVSP